MIYAIILNIVQILALLRIWVLNTTQKGFNALKSIFATPKPGNIAKDGKILNKHPKHLGVIFTEPTISMIDISKIIYWCLAIGIPHISLYDSQGKLKKSTSLVEENARKYLKTSHPHLDSSKVIVSDSYTCKQSDIHGQQLQVTILSAEDGRQSLIYYTKQLTSLISRGHLKASDIEPSYVDTLMQEKSNIADPELVIRFGPTASLLGYMPWQLRLTEILTHPSHHHIHYSSFYKLLQSYGGINQRFGK